jgi:hypothetical protein
MEMSKYYDRSLQMMIDVKYKIKIVMRPNIACPFYFSLNDNDEL